MIVVQTQNSLGIFILKEQPQHTKFQFYTTFRFECGNFWVLQEHKDINGAFYTIVALSYLKRK